MTARDAWIAVLFLVMTLLLALAVAGIVTDVVAPAIQQSEIGQAWSQAPR